MLTSFVLRVAAKGLLLLVQDSLGAGCGTEICSAEASSGSLPLPHRGFRPARAHTTHDDTKKGFKKALGTVEDWRRLRGCGNRRRTLHTPERFRIEV
jgi:hypothetical protein